MDEWFPVRSFDAVSEPLHAEVLSAAICRDGDRYRHFVATAEGVFELAEDGSWSKIEASDGR